MFDLTGRTALVTGATGGIGAAIARTFHQQGATVAVSGRQVGCSLWSGGGAADNDSWYGGSPIPAGSRRGTA